MCVVSRHRNLPPSDSLRVPPCLCFPGHTLQPLAVGARPDTVAFPLSLGRPPHVTPVCAVWGTGRPGQCRLVTPLPPVFHSTNPELRGRFRGLGLKSRAGDTAGGGGGGGRCSRGGVSPRRGRRWRLLLAGPSGEVSPAPEPAGPSEQQPQGRGLAGVRTEGDAARTGVRTHLPKVCLSCPVHRSKTRPVLGARDGASRPSPSPSD